MAEFPNTNPFNGYSTSWTQPYLPTSYNPFYTPKERVAGVNAVTEEMIRIAAVDNIVDNMLTYPDAERIIKQVMNLGDKNV
jgi:hypothetical protein